MVPNWAEPIGHSAIGVMGGAQCCTSLQPAVRASIPELEFTIELEGIVIQTLL